MTNIEQVIEALEMAVDTCRLRPSVDDCLETHDACQKALTTIRSLTEHGEGPYYIERRPNTGLVEWVVKGPTIRHAFWTNIEHAKSERDELNAAHQAGRLSAELQRGEPVAWMVKRVAPGKRDNGKVIGIYSRLADAEEWTDQNHIAIPLYTHTAGS